MGEEVLTVREICSRMGVGTRSVTAWIRAGIIPRPERRGRYSQRALLRAQAGAVLAKKLRRLRDVARELDALDDDALRALAGLPPEPADAPPAAEPLAPPSPAALHLTIAEAMAEAMAEAPPAPTPTEACRARAEPADRSAWRVIELVPGLELRVRADAPPFVQRLADAIAAGRFPGAP